MRTSKRSKSEIRVITSRYDMTDKWGRRLFKAGAVALLVLGLVHSLSLIHEPVPANDTEKQLLGLMSSYKFNLMRSSRSMADLLRGFSVSFMVAALGFGVFDLMLSRERAGLLKRTDATPLGILGLVHDLSRNRKGSD